MSITLKEHSRIDIFPQELLQHLARRFNGVVKTNVLVVKSNRFEILFRKFPGASEPVFVNLFTKIVLAMNSIKKKYLTHENHNIHLSVRMDSDNIEYYRLIITGANKIPPGKLFNLFPLILWYYIKYQTGEKPSTTTNGQLTTEKWKKEEIYSRKELNSSDRQTIYTKSLVPCNQCGNPSEIIINWNFFYRKERRYIPMVSKVCEKHRLTVI